jgi:hypothetical protein
LIFDILEKIKYKRHNERFKISLFTKVAIFGFIIVSIIGLALSFGFEYGYNGLINNTSYHDVAHFQCNNKEFGKAIEFNKI